MDVLFGSMGLVSESGRTKKLLMVRVSVVQSEG